MMGFSPRLGSSRMVTAWFAVLISLWLIGDAGRANAQQKPQKLKLYVSVDMEGIAGVVSPEQTRSTGFEYNAFRELMTQEARAAVDAAIAAGATEVVVSDSHGSGQNILPDRLPANNVTLVRSFPRPLGMMQGIDGSFDGAIFIGFHASTTSPEGVMAHTISSASFADVKLNGTSVSEAVFNAAIAGEFGVPVIMMSGDDVAVAEAKKTLGDIETAVVKWSYGNRSARNLHPEDARAAIRAAVTSAVRNIRHYRPYRLVKPVTLEIQFKNYRPAEVLAYLPMIRRPSSHVVQFQGADILEISRFVEFVLNYSPSLEP
jgi:D-amino peptidase